MTTISMPGDACVDPRRVRGGDAPVCAGPAAATDRCAGGPSPLAWGLYERLAELEVAVCWEPSFKLSVGTLLADRFLLSLTPPAPGGPRGRFTRILAGLGLPDCYLPVVEANLPDACHLHLGVEQGPGGCLHKFYLEFPLAQSPGLDGTPAGSGPPLVHIAFKWDPARAQRHTVTRYLDRSAADGSGLVQTIGTICDQQSGAMVAAAAALIERAAPSLAFAHMQLLEVLEEGNPRRSFDLRLYGSGLRLAALRDWLGGLWDHFGIAAAARRALLERFGGAPIGHLSGGVGRDGGEFCTIYYGAGRLQWGD